MDFDNDFYTILALMTAVESDVKLGHSETILNGIVIKPEYLFIFIEKVKEIAPNATVTVTDIPGIIITY